MYENKNENNNINYNKIISENIDENENEKNMSFFEKIYSFFICLDKKIFGISGEHIFKKYKNELLLFTVIILIIVILLFCYEDTNLIKQKQNQKQKQKQKGGNPLVAVAARAAISDPQGAMKVAKTASSMGKNMQSSANTALNSNKSDLSNPSDTSGEPEKRKRYFSGKGAINAGKTMGYMKKPYRKGRDYFGGILDRNKEYIREKIYDVLMFMIIFIVFIPSLSFIILILLSFRVLKPKISYIKSL